MSFKSKDLSPPIKGLYDTGSVAQIKPHYAVSMVNLIPRALTCDVRKGFTVRDAVVDFTPNTLLSFNDLDDGYLIAIDTANNLVFDVTTAGAESDITPVSAPTFSEDWFAGIHFKNNLLIYSPAWTNTDEEIYKFDGAAFTNAGVTYSASALTGVVSIATYQGDLYMVQNESMYYYYFDTTGALTGATKRVDLSPIFKRGGKLVNVNTFTKEAGTGIDDYIIFTTSEGESAIYSGTYEDLTLVGVLDIGSTPINTNCTYNNANTFLYFTIDGIFSLSSVNGGAFKADFSEGIAKLWREYTNLYKHLDYFNVTPIKNEDILTITIPVDASDDEFLIFSYTVSAKAWSTFRELPVKSLVVINDSCFALLASGQVVNTLSGYSDNGDGIVAGYQTPYVALSGQDSRISHVQPILATQESGNKPKAKAYVDFKYIYQADPRTLAPSPVAGTVNLFWTGFSWTGFNWLTTNISTIQPKIALTGIGRNVSLVVTVAQQTSQVSLTNLTLYYNGLQDGGYFSRNR